MFLKPEMWKNCFSKENGPIFGEKEGIPVGVQDREILAMAFTPDKLICGPRND